MENKDLNQKLYERLLDVVGTEDDIRSRQDMFKYMDIVNGFGDSDSISISAGSLSEGIDLKGSDEDIMLVLKNIDVVPVEDNQHKEGIVNVNMQLDTVRHGYASLFLSEEEEQFVNNSQNTERSEVRNIKCSIQTASGRCIVASSRFRGQFIRPGNESHGPCISDGDFDFAISLHGSVWPHSAKQRITACKSKRWISNELADVLMSEGCIYVPVGPRHYYHGTLWRISFAKSEKRLIMSMNHSQVLCYGLLKIVLKEGIAKQLPKNDIICSYFLKTCLFWLIEETDNDEDIWNINCLYRCYIMCLDKLMEWVQTCNCPNYIIPENNMFFGKIDKDNKSNILKVLSTFKDSGYDALSQCETLGSFMTSTRKLSAAEREAKLDVLCFRVLHIYPFDDTGLLLSALTVMETEYKAQTNHFTKGVISGLMSSLHQEYAQMVRPSENDENVQRIQQVQKEHLLKGCRSDKLCGLILLASFHHTHGFHYTAIEILNTVTETLLTSDSGLLLRRKTEYTEEEIYMYTSKFCGRDHTLEKKLEDATVRAIVFLDNSPIVPKEFQPEVHNYRPLILVSPVVYAYALKYLCHYHVNDKQKSQDALEMLDHIIDTRLQIINRHYSSAYTFVGACYETDGNYEKATKYYEMALTCKEICQSASYRLQRIETYHKC